MSRYIGTYRQVYVFSLAGLEDFYESRRTNIQVLILLNDGDYLCKCLSIITPQNQLLKNCSSDNFQINPTPFLTTVLAVFTIFAVSAATTGREL
jgi:hypothetical protein